MVKDRWKQISTMTSFRTVFFLCLLFRSKSFQLSPTWKPRKTQNGHPENQGGKCSMFLAAGCCKKYGEYEIQYNLVEDLYWIHETYLHFPMDFVCFVLKLSHFESAWFLLNDGLFWGMIIMICSSSFPGFRFVETSQKGGWMIFLRFWNGRFCADRICSDLESCLEFWNWTPVFCMSKDFVNRFHQNRGASWGMNSSGVVVQFLATCMVVEKHWDHKDLSYLYKSLVYNRNH